MKVICCGTFDQLHIGHRALLDMAHSVAIIYGGELIIGLMEDSEIDKCHPVRPYMERMCSILCFLNDPIKSMIKITVIGVSVFKEGTAIYEIFDNKTQIILVCSDETFQAGIEFNKMLNSLGLNSVTLYNVPIIKSKDG